MTPRTFDSSEGGVEKIVYLIRHAESEENRRLASFAQCFRSLGKFSLPSSRDVSAAAGLWNLPAQVDSPLSADGITQIQRVAEVLQKDRFIENHGVKLVAHSPLTRAKQTADGMLDCAAPDKKHPAVDRTVELDLLLEKTPAEWIPGNIQSLADRIGSFEAWLAEQPEVVICVVGHSQFFKAMLGLSFKLGNCDVWQVKFDPTKNSKVQIEVVDRTKHGDAESYSLPRGWSELKRLYIGAMPKSLENGLEES